jgi:hypothetical protein
MSTVKNNKKNDPKYSLRILQQAFLPITLRKEVDNENKCLHCWKSKCKCDDSELRQDLLNDLYLNATCATKHQYA